ncbi:MAG TPA: DUF1553 domain-containing protein [Tepidisphaeraceae bacterium]|jgi:hypothetical protein
MHRHHQLYYFWLIPLLACTVAVGAPTTKPAAVSFNRDVRPILSDTCFKCHGFDASKRKADLRLDSLEGATKDLGSGAGAIVPHHPEESEGYRRLISDDPEEKMPPPASGLTVTKEQQELIKQWIAQGAQYEAHWSLVKPVAPRVPQVQQKDWPQNPIDNFILAKLEQENVKPSAEADRVTLIRRVTLDLTGLPPTPAEVDAFLADQSPTAYERLVDRLLASPRYGERMAMRWLDLARYADTNGYQIDTERAQWPWRDWVIEAFNSNQPFDKFTVEQLAGDLIPNATLEQKVASGFNRNHRITLEGGSIPEEFRTEYVFDRVETTATTWLGLTMGCARCHDHKYDPITQKDFYRFFAFFNNVPENGIDGQFYNSTPFIPVPQGAARAQLTSLESKVATADAVLTPLLPKIAEAQAKWERAQPANPKAIKDGLIAHYPLDGSLMDVATPCRSGEFQDGATAFTNGIFDQAADLDGKRIISLGDTGRLDRTDAFSFGAWVYTIEPSDGAIIARMQEKGSFGYNLYWQNGMVHFQLINKPTENMLAMVTKTPIPGSSWHHIFVTYDGSSKAAGAKVYLDGKPLDMNVYGDTLTKTIAADTPLQIGARTGGTKFRGRVDEVRFYNRALKPEEVGGLGNMRMIAARVPTTQRTADQNAAILAMYLETAPKDYKEAIANADAAKAERQKLLDATPTVMVMKEIDKPRETFILKRGQYDMPGEKVTAGTPGCLPPLPKDAAVNRLTLAKWIVDPTNPLTARVTVNRFWEMYFGTGIVKSSEDFGMQSEFPSHPELLDWLATEFVRSGWDTKAMQKLIVTSSTYKQGSKVTPALIEKDPANLLLARMPRLRLPAEFIRDQALNVSGLLVEKLGGPSVKPYQPPKIWEEVTSGGGYTGQTYTQDHGESLYRRSLYTFWKRTVPPPTMSVFDAPSREICTVRRSRTNTPLQALALLNDTIYVEAARKLAERAINEGGAKPSDRITKAFRLTVGRKPTDKELTILVEDFNAHLATYFNDPEAAAKLLAVGESPRNTALDQRELAAYTAVSGVILNMDQTITRE